MKEDAFLTWSPFEAKRRAFYSAHGAAVLATNFTVPFVLAALLTLYWTSGREGLHVQLIRKRCLMTVCGAILFWLPFYVLLPRIPVVVQMRPERRNEHLHIEIPTRLAKEAGQQGKNFMPDIAWVRQQLGEASVFRRNLDAGLQTNFFTGQLWREEDSPGNCTVRQTAEGIEYVWYDLEGGEHEVPLFR